MNRRELLAALGTGFVGLAVGLESVRPVREGRSDGRGDASTAEPEDRLEPSDCPPFGADVGRVVCYDEIEPEEEPVLLAASPRRLSIPTTRAGSAVEFALANRGERNFRTGFTCWRLRKRDGGEWFDVAAGSCYSVAQTLRPGNEHAWTLPFGDHPVGRVASPDLTPIRGVDDARLGGGTYAFCLTGSFEGRQTEIGFAATFVLDGPPVELGPDPSVTTDRDGGTLAVETGGAADAHRPVRVAVEPVDYGGVARRIIAEEAYRHVGLRNTLPYFEREGVERVVLSTADSPLVVPDGAAVIEYEGTAYRIEVRRPE